MSKNIQKLFGSAPFDFGNGLKGRLTRRQDGRLELTVIIDDETAIDNVRKAWGAIDRTRQSLREFQGSDMQNLRNSLMHGYADMKAKGWSYKAIAMDINYDCLVNLCRCLVYEPDLSEPMVDPLAFSHAMCLLDCMGMKEERIFEHLFSALKEICEERSPWSLDSEPVNDMRVRDALRQWDHQQKKHKVVVKSAPATQLIPTSELANANRAENDLAIKLLEKTYPGSWLKYQNSIVQNFLKQSYSGTIG